MEELQTRTILDRQAMDRGLDALASRLRKRLSGGEPSPMAVPAPHSRG
ncbi:MAG: hypothetical protein ACE5H3_04180 [Planctomycetota bacterium]